MLQKSKMYGYIRRKVLCRRCSPEIQSTGNYICKKQYRDQLRPAFTYKRSFQIAHSRVTRVACIHYPHITGQYGLYFCKLPLYRQQQFVHLSQHIYDPYIMLPVFFDHDKNEYARPKDLIPMNNSPPNRNRNLNTINEVKVTSYHHTPKTTRNIEPIVSSQPPTPTIQTYVHSNPISIPPANNHEISTASRNNITTKSSPPPSVMEYSIPEIPRMDANTFPELPSSRPSSPRNAMSSNIMRGKKLFSPKLSTEKVRVNRVMRIVAQRSANYPSNVVTDR